MERRAHLRVDLPNGYGVTVLPGRDSGFYVLRESPTAVRVFTIREGTRRTIDAGGVQVNASTRDDVAGRELLIELPGAQLTAAMSQHVSVERAGRREQHSWIARIEHRFAPRTSIKTVTGSPLLAWRYAAALGSAIRTSPEGRADTSSPAFYPLSGHPAGTRVWKLRNLPFIVLHRPGKGGGWRLLRPLPAREAVVFHGGAAAETFQFALEAEPSHGGGDESE